MRNMIKVVVVFSDSVEFELDHTSHRAKATEADEPRARRGGMIG